MAVVRKKQDDKNLKVLREIVSLNGNKQCFDCGQRGPTYVNMTIGSFVCTRCSGILRGLTPPHRVKSISMATFTSDEIDFIRSHGNDDCAKTWMGLWDPKRPTTQDHRELLVDKYERKRYYLEPASPLKSITTTSQQQQQITNNTTSNNHNSSNNSDNIAALKAINLTPPSSLPLFKNNSVHHQQYLQQQQHLNQKQQQHHHTTINNNNNTNNTMNATSNFQQQFTPDDSNSLFNQQQQQIRLNNNNSNQINNNNNLNGLNRNGLNTNNNSNKTMVTATTNGVHNHNKFTPNSDFTADFSTANIFNSSSNTNNNNNNNNHHHNNINNSKNSIDNNKLISNSNRPRQNGLSTSSLPTSNGTTATTAVDENFADFEHNDIYNAGANPNSNPNNNMQWNVWQQFQWPYVQPEQNRWSLPMSLSSTSNSLNSSGTFTSNSSLNSTPSADRYAALKDLDEQIRENKEKEKMEQAVFNTTTTVTANPFKTASNPFQQPQSQQQQQSQQPQHQNQQQTQVQNSWSQHEQVFGMNTTASLYNQSVTNSDQFNQHFVAHQQLQQQNFIPNGFGAGQSPFNPIVGSSQNHISMMNGYNSGMISQASMSNPFQSSVTSNNPFL